MIKKTLTGKIIIVKHWLDISSSINVILSIFHISCFLIESKVGVDSFFPSSLGKSLGYWLPYWVIRLIRKLFSSIGWDRDHLGCTFCVSLCLMWSPICIYFCICNFLYLCITCTCSPSIFFLPFFLFLIHKHQKVLCLCVRGVLYFVVL
jgi:hypothetical protein